MIYFHINTEEELEESINKSANRWNEMMEKDGKPKETELVLKKRKVRRTSKARPKTEADKVLPDMKGRKKRTIPKNDI